MNAYGTYRCAGTQRTNQLWYGVMWPKTSMVYGEVSGYIAVRTCQYHLPNSRLHGSRRTRTTKATYLPA